ncbi:MAG: glycine cleavage T C-terminal barrel domain-containing protein [Vicinamibacterales bacterium]
MSRIDEQYRIIATAAGWVDRGARGRIRATGADAASFLHALLTNDVTALASGDGLYAAYLTPQGRMIDDLRLYRRGRPDANLLLDVEPGRAADLAARLDGSLFAEDVSIADVSSDTAAVRVLGRDAAPRVAAAFGLDAARLEALPPLGQIDLPADATGTPGDAFVARADDLDVPAFDVVAPAGARDTLVGRLETAGVWPVDDDLVEALRIAAGRPRFGADMTTETIPLEAGVQDRAISMTKGCYPGQEVIVRVLHRGGGRVAKRLVRIALPPDAAGVPEAGVAILAGGEEAGRVTSAAWSPTDRRVHVLGYVRRELAESPAPVTVGSATGTITGLAG